MSIDILVLIAGSKDAVVLERGFDTRSLELESGKINGPENSIRLSGLSKKMNGASLQR